MYLNLKSFLHRFRLIKLPMEIVDFIVYQESIPSSSICHHTISVEEI